MPKLGDIWWFWEPAWRVWWVGETLAEFFLKRSPWWSGMC